MKKYDLHIHSQFSDGDYSVEEIVSKVRECGIEIFSITDHDNIESIKAMENVDKRGVVYIPGVEISCEKDDYKMHLASGTARSKLFLASSASARLDSRAA